MGANLRGPWRQIAFMSNDCDDEQRLLLRRRDPEAPLPVPPDHLMQYRETAERHLQRGQSDANTIRAALAAAGYAHAAGKRTLEFACANARVLRWFADWAEDGEAWGVDINANSILWAQANLSPPFYFLVSTTQPHLPFEDGYFDVVLCNSIFTHIDDLFTAWIQELRRITVRDGFIWITVHDEDTIPIVQTGERGLAVFKADPAFMAYVEDGDFVALGRHGIVPQVFIKRAYLEALMDPWFTLQSREANTVGGFQGGYLFRRLR
ncbi:MAG: class I SAM-dependent methyltransferase [Hyphomicrobiales bacterium]